MSPDLNELEYAMRAIAQSAAMRTACGRQIPKSIGVLTCWRCLSRAGFLSMFSTAAQRNVRKEGSCLPVSNEIELHRLEGRLLHQVLSHSDQSEDSLLHHGEARIAGLPQVIAMVNLLQHHRDLEQGEYFII